MKEVWYPKNRKKHIRQIKKLKLKLTSYIDIFKRNKVCVDCGYSGKQYPQVLEFDHVRAKKFEVSSFTRHILSLKRLQEEMGKCELVCANCHRIRTVKRRKIN